MLNEEYSAVARKVFNLPDAVIERMEEDEFERLRAELGRFYAFGYGPEMQRRFLSTPHPDLRLETPAEALTKPDTIEGVIMALYKTLRSIRSY